MLNVIARKLGTFRAQVSEKGLARSLRISVERGSVWLLAKRYSFPSTWHPPTSLRPYRLPISDAVNALDPKVVCEVGCGIGSILSRIHAPERIGYDLDPGVLRAARLIRSRRIDFRPGSLTDVTVPRIDVLILVNWIHEIGPEELARDVLPLLERTKYLVVDAIDPGNRGYTYYHDFAFLEGCATERQRLRVPGESRTFIVYKVGG
jgi:hypothetical protein